MYMQTILVTGGCGFIGSNFLRFLLERESDVQVINLDALTYAGNPNNVRDLLGNPRYRFVRGDVADRALVRSILDQGVTDIIHFAAESHVDRSIDDAGPFLHTNVLGTQVLLDAARAARIGRYLQVSTDEVYGSLGHDGAFTEQTPLAPNSPYAASKAAADLLVRSYIKTYDLPALITRCSNNYGPYQFPEKLLPLFITNLMGNQSVPIYGDGLNIRDWLHVHDHCSAIYAVWKRGTPGEIYNIGGDCERTNLEMTHLLLKILDKPSTLIRYVPDRPGHDRRYAIDATKIQRELGWKPTITLEQGLAETVAWYRGNPSWIEQIRTGAYRDAPP